MSIIYWITVTQGLACAVLLISAAVLWCGGWPGANEEQRSSYLLRMMAVGNLVSALTYIPYFVFGSLPEPVDAVWHNLADTFCVIVMAFLSLDAIALRQKRLRWFHWIPLVVLPSLVTIVLACVAGDNGPAWAIWGTLLYFGMAGMYGAQLVLLVRWNRHLKDEFSDLQHKQVQWFWHLTLPIMLFTMLWIPMNIYPNLNWLNIVYYVTEVVVFLFFTSYALQQSIFTEEEVKLSDEIEENCPISDEVMAPAWIERLERAMNEDHIYRQPGLNMAELGHHIGVNRTYLSRYFHQTQAGSFYEYINSYRLREAEQLLSTTSLNLDEIAANCGFGNRSSLIRLFKEQYHMTPSDYRKQKNR